MGKKVRGDFSIVIIVAAICIFGTVMIASASYYFAINTYGDPYYFLKRQIVWLFVGSIALFFFSKIDYHNVCKLWVLIYLGVLALLILLLIPGVGINFNGSTRSISIFDIITIMPGEFSKPAMVFFITGYFSRHPSYASSFKKGIIPVGAAAGIYVLLIMKQPNMSTAFTMVIVVGLLLFVAGAKIKHLIICGLGSVAAAAALIFTSDYRKARYLSFLDPFASETDEGYQVAQSLKALGTGGIRGVGLGKSIQKTLYLPEPQNDFILPIIGEELGLIAIIALMIAYLFLIYKGLKTAMNANDLTGTLLASGIVLLIGVQVIINIAVVTSCIPPTGVVLPFVSYGNNALIIFMSAIGMLMNVSKSINEKKAKEELRRPEEL